MTDLASPAMQQVYLMMIQADSNQKRIRRKKETEEGLTKGELKHEIKRLNKDIEQLDKKIEERKKHPPEKAYQKILQTLEGESEFKLKSVRGRLQEQKKYYEKELRKLEKVI